MLAEPMTTPLMRAAPEGVRADRHRRRLRHDQLRPPRRAVEKAKK